MRKFILLLLLAVGCGPHVRVEPTNPGHFHADVDFNAEQMRRLEIAAETWNYYSNGISDLTVTQDLDTRNKLDMARKCVSGCLIHGDSADADFVMMDSEHHDRLTLGVTTGIMHQTVKFAMDRLGNLEDLQEVALHEFGHTFGMAHIPDKTAIMYQWHMVPGTKCPKQSDMFEFCRAKDCSIIQVQWCE